MEESKIGKWVIVMVMPPYPTGVGKIVGDYKKYQDVKLPWATETWDKRYCKIYNTEQEAQDAYDKFTKNKNNYALEG